MGDLVKALGLIALAVTLYYGLRTDAPYQDKPWRSYGLNKSTGKLEWSSFDEFKSLDECKFSAEKALNSGYYQQPSGCLYRGYQNPYVQWLVNKVVGDGMFRCIAQRKARDKYEDFVYAPVLRDFPSDHSETWDCVLSG
ncbi:hypothetical protein JQ616_12520 [Bradyrhizobium tropiciagri]|uniref:hypothetical protein n=1 Tax=Bradyrhizobium tropiciagri TaxID=312253 RepID=UPI001BACFB85|nr:hypothetical protein [Bradyrhizobium tropiciagri]MBR0895779.1 hypothetical protein [Bradyrhizobium tropiciagri]